MLDIEAQSDSHGANGQKLPLGVQTCWTGFVLVCVGVSLHDSKQKAARFGTGGKPADTWDRHLRFYHGSTALLDSCNAFVKVRNRYGHLGQRLPATCRRRVTTLLLALLVVAAPAPAAWEGEVQFGFLSNRGNTDSEAANLRVRAATEREGWRHRLRFDALRDQESGVTTAERYLFDGNVNYLLGERDYIFGNLRYERDRFSGFDSQTSLTGGYGYLFKPRTNLALELQGGGGARYSQLDDGEREDETILRGLVLLRWEISDNAQFKQSLVVEDGEENTLAESFTELRVNIVRKWAVSFSLNITRNSNPPAGNKNTDSRTSVNLVYKFGKRDDASETK